LELLILNNIAAGTAKLGDKEIEYVLLHELAHYKRKDTLVNLLLLGFR